MNLHPFWQKCPGKTDLSISRVNVHFSKNKALPFPWWKWSSVINLPPVNWLIYPGNGAILGTWSWYLLQENKILSNGYVATHLAVWKLMLLRPLHNSIPATTATLFLSPLDNNRSQKRDWLVSIKQVILLICFITLSFTELTHWWKFMWDTNNSNNFSLICESKTSSQILLSCKELAYTIVWAR